MEEYRAVVARLEQAQRRGNAGEIAALTAEAESRWAQLSGQRVGRQRAATGISEYQRGYNAGYHAGLRKGRGEQVRMGEDER